MVDQLVSYQFVRVGLAARSHQPPAASPTSTGAQRTRDYGMTGAARSKPSGRNRSIRLRCIRSQYTVVPQALDLILQLKLSTL